MTTPTASSSIYSSVHASEEEDDGIDVMIVPDKDDTNDEEVAIMASKATTDILPDDEEPMIDVAVAEDDKVNDTIDDETTNSDKDSTAMSTSSKATVKETEIESAPPSLLRLLQLARPEWGALLLAVLLMFCAEASGLINPLIIANAYDVIVDADGDFEDSMSEINRIMGTVLVILISGAFAGFLRSALMGVIGERLVARLRNELYSSMLSQEIAFFDEHKSGELISRLSSDSTLIQAATSLSLPEFALGVIKIVVSVTLMFWISIELAALTIGSVLSIFLIAIPFGTIVGRLSKSYQDALGLAQTRSTEALASMRTVQSFAAEDRERNRYSAKIGNPDDFPYWWPTSPPKGSISSSNSSDTEDTTTTYSVGFYKAIWTSAFYVFIFGFGFTAMYLSLWFGFKLVTEGQITLGQLTAFQSYIFQIGFGLAGTSAHLTKVIEALGASGRIFFLLDRVPTIPTPPPSSSPLAPSAPSPTIDTIDTMDTDGSTILNHPSSLKSPQPPLSLPLIRPESMRGEVVLKNVTFAYASRPNNPVLKDFSLVVPPNTTAALVGSSGGGKSTVVNLLQRFYDVQEGSIQMDGHDLKSLDLPWLRQNIGYVQQEPSLFGLTVRENVCYGLSQEKQDQLSQEDLERVCVEANAHDFITSWPQGYDTMVGERGVKLSGGQKQRIAIARALLVNPRVLLLDEATSALDAESEHLVQEAIEKAMVGRTVVIVAHRLSTIQRADQIVVLHNHRVVDVGTHQVLLQRCSKYQDLIRRQNLHAAAP